MELSSKKKYSKPKIDFHLIDNEISLIMMSYTDDTLPPPPPLPPSASQAQSKDGASTFSTSSQLDNNPFE